MRAALRRSVGDRSGDETALRPAPDDDPAAAAPYRDDPDALARLIANAPDDEARDDTSREAETDDGREGDGTEDDAAPASARKGRAAEEPWTERMPVSTRPIVAAGVATIGTFLLAFVVWGWWLPLQSSVVMAGQLVPEGKHRKVQHDAGGRVVAIVARDGDAVARGDVILRLDPVDARAELTQLEARRARLSAMRASLTAAGEGAARPSWGLRGLDARPVGTVAPPAWGTDAFAGGADAFARGADPFAAIRDAQAREFQAGRARLEREIAALEAKGEALARQRTGLAQQVVAQEELAGMVEADIAKLVPLARKGLIAARRVDDLRRSLAEQRVRIEGMRADLAAKGAQRVEIEAAIDRARATDREAVAERLTRVLGELAETEDAILAAREGLARTAVRAPVAGTLVKARHAALGGVVAPGEVVAEIVPEGTALMVEARARPDDIVALRPGQSAEVMLTALGRRDTDALPAEVAYVAGDVTRDGEDGDPYYLVRLALPTAGALPLQPGMQAEIYVAGPERTFLDYLLEPVASSFSRAFRER